MIVDSQCDDPGYQVGSAVCACTTLKRMFVREPSTFQYQMSLKIINDDNCGGVYTTTGPMFYIGMSQHSMI